MGSRAGARLGHCAIRGEVLDQSTGGPRPCRQPRPAAAPPRRATDVFGAFLQIAESRISSVKITVIIELQECLPVGVGVDHCTDVTVLCLVWPPVRNQQTAIAGRSDRRVERQTAEVRRYQDMTRSNSKWFGPMSTGKR
jgi:hypothetical protein